MNVQQKSAINAIIIEGLEKGLPISEMYKQAKNWETEGKHIDDLFFDLYYLRCQRNALKEQLASITKIIAMKINTDD